MFDLRVLGLTLFEAHLTDESSRLVTETLARRRERLIRYVFKEQGPQKPITQTMLRAQICGQAPGSRPTPEMGTPAMELDFWWKDRNESVNL